LEKIQKSADEMLNTIDDIMLSTRIINNKAEIVPKSFDIRRSIKNAQDELKDYLKNKKHSIVVKTNRKLPLAIGDEFASQILIINLIKHCSELMSSESELTISLRMTENELQLLVRSRGLNINQNSHNRSINTLGTIRQPLTESISVDGLNLYLASEIAKRMSGRVKFVPTSTGSCYALSLPTNEQLRLL
jgi:K+-sensing histidine kinase KdpD